MARRLQNQHLSQSIFFFIYIFTFSFSALMLAFNGLDFITSISAVVSAISNLGPGLGEIIGANSNYSYLNSNLKIIIILTMFLGRLEMQT